jgi:hypothetical protein
MKTKSNMLVVGLIIIIIGVAGIIGSSFFKEKTSRFDSEKTNLVGASNEQGGSSSKEHAGISRTSSSAGPTSSAESFVASNRGKKYYPVACSSAKTIKKENLISFSSSAEADAAGYTQSSSCKY